MKLLSDTIIQKWRDADSNSDSLIAETAFAAVTKRPAITTREFATALRDCGISGNTTLLNYALACAKIDGANLAGVAAQVATKRAEVAKKQLEKQREAAAARAKREKEQAELEALKEKAATNAELAVELVERNLTEENEKLIELEREQMRITLLVNKSRRVLENAGHKLCDPVLEWTHCGMDTLAECRELAALAKPEVECWLDAAIAERTKLSKRGTPTVDADYDIKLRKRWLEIVEINRSALAAENK